ncbi:MAG TPA: hypothetical protein DCE81_05365 [Cytophagales bacterium]|nr:hypothetical protein [Cytophagales bacterium]
MKPMIVYFVAAFIFLGCNHSKNPANPESADTKTSLKFDLVGNYIPTTKIEISGHFLESFAIGTKDTLNEFKVKYVYVCFDWPENEEYYWVENTQFSGTKDNFSISAKDSIIGDFNISGRFFGEQGHFYDVTDPATIVFKGTITAKGVQQNLECRYFEGD